jgi:hypothetical protein
MMRSLSRRIRFATSSTRASAPLLAEREEPDRRELEERPLVDRLRLLLLRPLRLLLEPLRLPELLRPPEVLFRLLELLLRLLEPLFRLLEPLLRLLEPLPRLLEPLLRLLDLLLLRPPELRVLRRPLLPELDRRPEPDPPDPPDPPLLACGMLPPFNELKSGRHPISPGRRSAQARLQAYQGLRQPPRAVRASG